jgi:hypothetical protein
MIYDTNNINLIKFFLVTAYDKNFLDSKKSKFSDILSKPLSKEDAKKILKTSLLDYMIDVDILQVNDVNFYMP